MAVFEICVVLCVMSENRYIAVKYRATDCGRWTEIMLQVNAAAWSRVVFFPMQ